MGDHWHKRSVGIKLWGFEADPYILSSKISAITDPIAKGEPHGSKNFYKENLLYILKLLNENEYWGDTFLELIDSIGGIAVLSSLIEAVNPRSYFVVINLPKSDVLSGGGNHLSKEATTAISNLDCDVQINYF